MGARGKKRRRADGSIAGKPQQAGLGYGGPHSFEPLGAVLPGTLAKAVDISKRYIPIDGSDPGDWDWEAQSEEMDAFADREGVDSESLAIRAEKLLDLLRLPDGEQYYVLSGDRLVIDRALLEFAASTPIDSSNKPLAWSPSAAEADDLVNQPAS